MSRALIEFSQLHYFAVCQIQLHYEGKHSAGRGNLFVIIHFNKFRFKCCLN